MRKKISNFNVLIFIFLIGLIIGFGKNIFLRNFFNERITVIPNVLSLTEEEAIEYINKSGLKAKVNYSVTEHAPLDTVFIQFPEAGKEVKVNRLVQIWVNSGKSVEIPNVIGMELLEARPILDSQNIEIERIDYEPSNQKYNTIIGIYPEVGSKLEVNQKVTLLVSSQKISDPSNVPNLVGLDLDNAKILLTQLGLELGEITYSEDPTLPVDTIITTFPETGAEVKQNDKINLVINKGFELKQEGQSIEDIINETNKEILNREIENIINETLNKLDESKKENVD